MPSVRSWVSRRMTEFTIRYRDLNDDELLQLWVERSQLTAEARNALETEILNRRLSEEADHAGSELKQSAGRTLALRLRAIWVRIRTREGGCGKWKLSDAFVVGLSAFFAVVIGISIEITFRLRFPLFQVLTIVVVTTVVTALYRLRGITNLFASIGWNPNRIAVSAIIGCVLAAFITLIIKVGYGSTPRVTHGFAPFSIVSFLLNGVVIGPFVEEFYFRGILFVTLSEKIRESGALILITVLFALLHPPYRFALVPLLIGFVLGMTRIKTKSVAACFALHSTYNLGMLVSQFLLTR